MRVCAHLPARPSFYRKRHIPFGTSGHAFYRQVLIPPLSFGTPTRNEVVESHVEISFPPLNCVTRDILYSVRYLSDNFLRARERSFGSGKIRPNKFRGFSICLEHGEMGLIAASHSFVRSVGRAKAKASIRWQSGTE